MGFGVKQAAVGSDDGTKLALERQVRGLLGSGPATWSSAPALEPQPPARAGRAHRVGARCAAVHRRHPVLHDLVAKQGFGRRAFDPWGQLHRALLVHMRDTIRTAPSIGHVPDSWTSDPASTVRRRPRRSRSERHRAQLLGVRMPPQRRWPQPHDGAGGDEPVGDARVAADLREHRDDRAAARSIPGRLGDAPRLLEQHQQRDAEQRRERDPNVVVEIHGDPGQLHQPREPPSLHRPPRSLAGARPCASGDRVEAAANAVEAYASTLSSLPSTSTPLPSTATGAIRCRPYGT